MERNPVLSLKGKTKKQKEAAEHPSAYILVEKLVDMERELEEMREEVTSLRKALGLLLSKLG